MTARSSPITERGNSKPARDQKRLLPCLKRTGAHTTTKKDFFTVLLLLYPTDLDILCLFLHICANTRNCSRVGHFPVCVIFGLDTLYA